MFTGLIQDIGQVVKVLHQAGSRRLSIKSELDLATFEMGESLAVNGACYTVTEIGPQSFTVDVSPESLEKTTTARLQSGARVHLERALRLGDRLGGHLVLGHVDGVGRLVGRSKEGSCTRLDFSAPKEVAELLISKGSVAVDGVSLTINQVERAGFSVMIIPHTSQRTRLSELAEGAYVNLEGDVIGKYVARWLKQAQGSSDEGLGRLLKDSGFM